MNKLRAEYRWQEKSVDSVKLLLYEIITINIKLTDDVVVTFFFVIRTYFIVLIALFNCRNLKYYVKTLHANTIEKLSINRLSNIFPCVII